MTALELAILFHKTYERLAPDYGYETQEETREFDPDSKNGRLMVATCAEMLGLDNPVIRVPLIYDPDVEKVKSTMTTTRSTPLDNWVIVHQHDC